MNRVHAVKRVIFQKLRPAEIPNPKLQVPNKTQIPIIKAAQTALSWSLRFEASLEFGIWNF
jgi:hypothetical protein